jgi:hypothetical protein
MKRSGLKVIDGKFETESGVLMRSGCHHHPRTAAYACGGCYARAIDVLDRVNSGESGVELISALFEEMKAEKRRPRARSMRGGGR